MTKMAWFVSAETSGETPLMKKQTMNSLSRFPMVPVPEVKRIMDSPVAAKTSAEIRSCQGASAEVKALHVPLFQQRNPACHCFPLSTVPKPNEDGSEFGEVFHPPALLVLCHLLPFGVRLFQTFEIVLEMSLALSTEQCGGASRAGGLLSCRVCRARVWHGVTLSLDQWFLWLVPELFSVAKANTCPHD